MTSAAYLYWLGGERLNRRFPRRLNLSPFYLSPVYLSPVWLRLIKYSPLLEAEF